MKADPAIQRTRDARKRISASVGDDPVKVIDYYIEAQRRFAGRLRYGPDAIQPDAEHQLPAGAHKDARR